MNSPNERLPLDIGDEWEHLADATLRIYVDGYLNDSDEAQKRADKALQIWDVLTELDLSLPPDWVAAVWRATSKR